MSNDLLDVLDQGNAQATDQAKRDVTPYLGELLGRAVNESDGYPNPETMGQYTPFARFGGATEALPRLASVHPLAAGIGVALQLAGLGSRTASSTGVIAGRRANGPDDCFGLFHADLGASSEAWTGEIDSKTLKVDVPIPTNTPTLLLAASWTALRGYSGVIKTSAAIRIGAGTTEGTPGLDNVEGAIGPWAYGDLVLPIHARLMTVKTSNPTILTVHQSVSVRLRATGSTPRGTATGGWLLVARIPL